MNWETQEKKIKSCNLCPGLNSAALGTENAPGYGDKNSEVMILGQSLCGKPCIDAQIPFTGGSGKLLDDVFELAGIEKKDVFTTNVVKCHPPGNRPSETHEIENCRSYLNNELRWVSPKVIICLGKDAWGFANKAVNAECVESVQLSGQAITVHFLYHPSYIRRKPKKERDGYVAKIAKIISSAIA